MFARRSKEAASQLAESLEKISGKRTFETDAAEWKLTKDPAGNATAIIRLLPAKGQGGEDLPFVKTHSHFFQVGAQYYVENCPTVIDERCPVCDNNRELWATDIESNKKLASDRKRKLEYVANIVVIQDKLNPDSVGKVFKFKFGKQIMDIITAKAKGDPEAGIAPVDVTDVFDGCNLVVRYTKDKHGGSYKASQFIDKSELFNGDQDKLKEVFDTMHPLMPLISRDKFKPYTELLNKFNKVVGAAGGSARKVEDDLNDDVSSLNQTGLDDAPFELDQKAPASSAGKKPTTSSAPAVNVSGDDDIDAFFDSLEE